jgi:hypothetical protein
LASFSSVKALVIDENEWRDESNSKMWIITNRTYDTLNEIQFLVWNEEQVENKI